MSKPIKPLKDKFVGEQTVARRKNDFRIAILVLLAAFFILGALVKLRPQLAVDLYITLFLQHFSYGWFDLLMRTLTIMGNLIPVTTSIILVTLVLFLLKRQSDGLLLIISSIGASIISTVVKGIVTRPRPDPNFIHQIGSFASSDSFPSGHVLIFIGFYGFLLYLVFSRLKKSWLRTILIIFCAALLVLIGLSRIYLGAHWFSDVLGSYLIGGVWIYCLTKIDHKLISFGKK